MKFGAFTRLVSVVLVSYQLRACAAVPTPVVLNTTSFKGMSALVGPEVPQRPLHVLIVHGMGTPEPNGFDAFIASLAGRFKLVQVPPAESEPQWQGCHPETAAQPTLLQPKPQVIHNTAAAPDNQARLCTYNFAPSPDAKPTLTVSYLLWAPLTARVKCDLEAEDNGADAPSKEAFAAFAKDFIDDKLADAVLYSGAYRQKVIRPSIQTALCLVAGGKLSPDGKTCVPGAYLDPTVIITHSLGGYMLRDAIQAELYAEGCRPNAASSPAEKILENTPVIYMMANQLALLDLSTLRRDPHAPKVRPAIPSASDAITRQFAKCWIAARGRSKMEAAPSEPNETPAPMTQVVAFSDPNDILSWRLEPKNLKFPKSDWGDVAVTDVYLSNNEVSVPGLISDPVNAHTGYFVNSRVMDMLICGMDKGSIRPCDPSSSAP
jgi:hypothetical protein